MIVCNSHQLTARAGKELPGEYLQSQGLRGIPRELIVCYVGKSEENKLSEAERQRCQSGTGTKLLATLVHELKRQKAGICWLWWAVCRNYSGRFARTTARTGVSAPIKPCWAFVVGRMRVCWAHVGSVLGRVGHMFSHDGPAYVRPMLRHAHVGPMLGPC